MISKRLAAAVCGAMLLLSPYSAQAGWCYCYIEPIVAQLVITNKWLESIDTQAKMESAKADARIKSLANAFSDIIKAQSVANQVMKNKTVYSEVSAVRGPCQESQISSNISSLADAANKAAKDLADESQKVARSYTPESGAAQAMILAANTDQFKWGQRKAYTEEEIGEANNVLNAIITPTPPLQLPESLRRTAPGQAYLAQVKLNEAKLRPVRDALFSQLALNSSKLSPTDEKDAATIKAIKELYSSYGHNELPPQINKDGEISYAGLLDFYARLRAESPNYINDINVDKDPAYYIRSMATMQAQQFAIQNQIWREEQSQTTLLALIMAHMVDGQQVQINARAIQTLGLQANQ